MNDQKLTFEHGCGNMDGGSDLYKVLVILHSLIFQRIGVSEGSGELIFHSNGTLSVFCEPPPRHIDYVS